MDPLENIEENSEIKPPAFIIKYGLSLIFMIVLLALISSCFIKWQYNIPVLATITSVEKPEPGDSISKRMVSPLSYNVEIHITGLNRPIKKGDDVDLIFDTYPENQFGKVVGKISEIEKAEKANENIARVYLPHGLITDRNKEIKYSPGLQVQGSILISDISLFQYIFDHLVKLY